MHVQKREKMLSFKSDGLKNVSKNLLGLEFDDDERRAVDWVSVFWVCLDFIVYILLCLIM
jgi:hypothetical protein